MKPYSQSMCRWYVCLEPPFSDMSPVEIGTVTVPAIWGAERAFKAACEKFPRLNPEMIILR